MRTQHRFEIKSFDFVQVLPEPLDPDVLGRVQQQRVEVPRWMNHLSLKWGKIFKSAFQANLFMTSQSAFREVQHLPSESAMKKF